jgi:hypothetical protein
VKVGYILAAFDFSHTPYQEMYVFWGGLDDEEDA